MDLHALKMSLLVHTSTGLGMKGNAKSEKKGVYRIWIDYRLDDSPSVLVQYIEKVLFSSPIQIEIEIVSMVSTPLYLICACIGSLSDLVCTNIPN